MIGRLVAAVRGRSYGLRSKHIGEKTYLADLKDGQMRLHHSAFNTDWFAELRIQPQMILDLGSFDGGDAYRFKRAFPQARVVTIEADPTRYALVAGNLAGQDIEALNFAACDTDGEIDWFPAEVGGQIDGQGSIFRHTHVYSDMFPDVLQSGKACKVMGRRLDTLTAALGIPAIDLLHMDVEGAEHTVLMSLGNLRPSLIYLEWREGMFQGPSCGPETEALLKSLGYRLILKKTADRLYYRPK